MKILVLGNQARSMGNFWSVLIRHMRAMTCFAVPLVAMRKLKLCSLRKGHGCGSILWTERA